MLPQENFEICNPLKFYRIPKVVKYVEDMIFSLIIFEVK